MYLKSFEKSMNILKKTNNTEYILTSAKTGDNVKKAFRDLIQAVLDKSTSKS